MIRKNKTSHVRPGDDHTFNFVSKEGNRLNLSVRLTDFQKELRMLAQYTETEPDEQRVLRYEVIPDSDATGILPTVTISLTHNEGPINSNFRDGRDAREFAAMEYIRNLPKFLYKPKGSEGRRKAS